MTKGLILQGLKYASLVSCTVSTHWFYTNVSKKETHERLRLRPYNAME